MQAKSHAIYVTQLTVLSFTMSNSIGVHKWNKIKKSKKQEIIFWIRFYKMCKKQEMKKCELKC